MSRRHCRRPFLFGDTRGLIPGLLALALTAVAGSALADPSGVASMRTLPLQPGIAAAPKTDEPTPSKPEAKKPPPATRLEIPVKIEQLPLGEAVAFISVRDELLAFDGPALLKLLERFLVPEKLQALRARIGSGGRLTADDIRSEGIAVAYDIGRIEATLRVPLDMRTTQSLSLANPYGAERRELLAPADVSGYVNLLSGHDFVPNRDGSTPIVTDLDAALNLYGNVIESVGTYRDIGAAPWTRGDTRIVRDDPESRTRLSIGDVNYGIGGFQSYRRAGGISIARNFGLQPYRSSAPVGETDLNLDRNARVDVIVNGQRMRTLDLTPGRYNVRDLPLVGGTNDVTLRIVDEVGRVDVIRFPFVFDASVLAEGEQDFGYAIGFPSTATNAGRTYDRTDRVVSAFHTFGLTDQLTLGGNYQASRNVNLVGTEMRLATAIGTFRSDLSASQSSFAGTGGAFRIQHRFTESPSTTSRGRFLASTATYRSPDFTSISQTSASNPVALSLGVLFGQRLSETLYGSLGVARQFARDGQPNVTTGDASMSMQIAEDVTASLLLSTRQASYGGSDNRIFLGVSWFPRGSGQRVGTSYDTTERARRVDWSYTPTMRVDGVQADLALGRDAGRDTIDGDVGYTGYRFTTSASHATMTERGDGNSTHPRTRVNFGTAIAFAGGQTAITRPINDSFALFVPHPSLAGQSIEVNNISETPQARTDILGTAVLPELGSYYQHHVTIDAPELPLGYELGRQVYDLQPTYRSGTVINVGTGATVLGDGLLVDAEDKPLPLEAGTITSVDDPSRPAIDFFTSRGGRFRVEGLSSGRFRLTLANDPDKAIEFDIPADSTGRVDLGRLTYPITP